MKTLLGVLAAALFQIPLALVAWSQTEPAERPIAILLAAGDIAKCGSTGKDAQTAELIRSVYKDAQSHDIPVHVLALGDLAYDHGSAADFACFAKTWGTSELYPLLLPVPGNHDYESSRSAKPYFDFFSNNHVVKDSRSIGGYYSLSIRANGQVLWQLYGLNAYAGAKKGSAQFIWLEHELQQSTAPCILAFWHPFLFSSGHHGHLNKPNPSAPVRREDLMTDAFSLLQKQGASLVLTGHDHDFEQFGRQDVDGNKSANGIRSFVVGTGGGLLYRNVNYVTRAPNSEFYDQNTYGVLRVEIYPSRYTWDFIPISGSSKFQLNPNSEECNVRSPQ